MKSHRVIKRVESLEKCLVITYDIIRQEFRCGVTAENALKKCMNEVLNMKEEI